MKYFLFGLVGASTLFFIPSTNAMQNPKGDLNPKQFEKTIQKRLSKLAQQKSCLENSSDFNQLNECKSKTSKYKTMDFDKFVEKKIKKIDKMANCIEKTTNYKEFKSCKKNNRKRA